MIDWFSFSWMAWVSSFGIYVSADAHCYKCASAEKIDNIAKKVMFGNRVAIEKGLDMLNSEEDGEYKGIVFGFRFVFIWNKAEGQSITYASLFMHQDNNGCLMLRGRLCYNYVCTVASSCEANENMSNMTVKHLSIHWCLRQTQSYLVCTFHQVQFYLLERIRNSFLERCL